MENHTPNENTKPQRQCPFARLFASGKEETTHQPQQNGTDTWTETGRCFGEMRAFAEKVSVISILGQYKYYTSFKTQNRPVQSGEDALDFLNDLHKEMRICASNIGKLMDTDRLPESVQQTLNEAKNAENHYAKFCHDFYREYKDIFPDVSAIESPSQSIVELRKHVSDEDYLRLSRKFHALEKSALKALENVITALNGLETIPIKMRHKDRDVTFNVPNERFDQHTSLALKFWILSNTDRRLLDMYDIPEYWSSVNNRAISQTTTISNQTIPVILATLKEHFIQNVPNAHEQDFETALIQDRLAPSPQKTIDSMRKHSEGLALFNAAYALEFPESELPLREIIKQTPIPMLTHIQTGKELGVLIAVLMDNRNITEYGRRLAQGELTTEDARKRYETDSEFKQKIDACLDKKKGPVADMILATLEGRDIGFSGVRVQV